MNIMKEPKKLDDNEIAKEYEKLKKTLCELMSKEKFSKITHDLIKEHDERKQNWILSILWHRRLYTD